MIRAAAMIAALIVLFGCAAEEYTSADGLILCDPLTGRAFYVVQGRVENSRVRRVPQADKLMCGNEKGGNDV